MEFGEFIKNKRLLLNLSLRKFCELVEIDPSNWSKVERGVMPLTTDQDKLLEIIKVLKILEGTTDYTKFFDLASVAKRKIPDYVYNNAELLNLLPVFFRTASKDKPSDEELEKLVELIRRK